MKVYFNGNICETLTVIYRVLKFLGSSEPHSCVLSIHAQCTLRKQIGLPRKKLTYCVWMECKTPQTINCEHLTPQIFNFTDVKPLRSLLSRALKELPEILISRGSYVKFS